MASKSDSKPRSPRSFPRRGNISSLQNYVIVKVMLKTMWGETEGLILLSWSVFFVGGRVVRPGRERRGGMGSKFSCVAAGMERLSLDLSRVVKNIVGCGSVWNL